MWDTLDLDHERVDDIPLILGLATRLKLPDVLDQCLGRHHLHQGLSPGWIATVWIVYILSQADHRKAAVRDWARAHRSTLERLIGQPIRDADFTDDRLAILLRHLAPAEARSDLEARLWTSTCEVYQLPVEQVRLDSTTSYGFHTVTDGGLMQRGQSKDHRPDLPQLKLMAAAAEPTGVILATAIHPGNTNDDPLYLPLIIRLREVLGRRGLLYCGDCKMAALETRADLQHHGDYYLVPLPLSPSNAALLDRAVTSAVEGDQVCELLWDGPRLLGAGYEVSRQLRADGDAEGPDWAERLQVVRSRDLAEGHARTLEQNLIKAAAAAFGLTPPRGRGRRLFRDEGALQQALAKVWEQFGVTGLMEAEVRQDPEAAAQGVARWEVTAVRRRTEAIGARRARQGWRLYATDLPAERMDLGACVRSYRCGWCLERDFHLLKDAPLGIRPLYVRRDDQLMGLSFLLLLALRVLSLCEVLVRRGQQRRGDRLAGLYVGQPSRRTDQPTGLAVLRAVARLELTLTRLRAGDEERWHLTELPPLVRRVLEDLGLEESWYTRLVDPAP
jgi:transposase